MNEKEDGKSVLYIFSRSCPPRINVTHNVIRPTESRHAVDLPTYRLGSLVFSRKLDRKDMSGEQSTLYIQFLASAKCYPDVGVTFRESFSFNGLCPCCCCVFSSAFGLL
jgi:hypothetical protein